jgi:hypothetical protein
VLAASVLYSAYLVWCLKRTVRFPLRTWALAIALGGLFLPLAWLRWSWPVNVAFYCALALIYGVLLLVLRVVTPGEVVNAWRVVALGRHASQQTES